MQTGMKVFCGSAPCTHAAAWTRSDLSHALKDASAPRRQGCVTCIASAKACMLMLWCLSNTTSFAGGCCVSLSLTGLRDGEAPTAAARPRPLLAAGAAHASDLTSSGSASAARLAVAATSICIHRAACKHRWLCDPGAIMLYMTSSSYQTVPDCTSTMTHQMAMHH